MGEARPFLLSMHETSGLLEIPRPLSLVKDDDVIDRRPRINQSFIPEVMDILNEGFDTLAYFPFTNPFTTALSAQNLIASEGFTQNGNQWAVSRKENCVRGLIAFPSARSDVQPDECLAGTGNSCNETNDLTSGMTRFIH